MFKLSNISIGLKLSMMSGLGILFVVGLIATQMMGSASVRSSNEAADFQGEVVRSIAETKASLRGMAMGGKDIRLSRNNDQLQAALKFVDDRLKSVHMLADPLLAKLSRPENRARVEKLTALSEQYAKSVREIATVKTQIFEAQARQPAGDITEFERKDADIAKAAVSGFVEAEKLLEEVNKSATEIHAEKTHQSEAAMVSADRLGLGLVTALILIASAFLGAFTIAKPLKALVRPLEEVAAGNFAITVPGTGRKDEVGQIAEAVQLMAQKVSSTIGEIKASGREVTNASAEIATSTTDLSQRTEEQAASLEQTSAAMEELSATVKKNAENAQMANTDANTTRDVADRGGKVVAQAVEAMAKIEDSSRKISDIIGVIDEIARQTNLLALNAAVEAARAGEAGRGFAVVASEVRSLAQRSSQAAKDIKDLITSSNGQVKDGVALVNRAGESLTEILESIKKVAAGVSDIANASIEQATGIEQINKALTQMDEVTQQNSALVEENAATAKTLEHQAKAMDEQVAFFQIGGADDRREPSRAREPMARPAPRKAAPPSRGPAARSQPMAAPKRAAAGGGGARGMQTALATAVNADNDWKEF
jgi:methyl-accepting chemotaxis protein